MALTTTKQRKEIGERLRVERERLTYTTLQIAQLIGVPESAYLTYETGEADPGIFCKPVPEENELLQRFRELSLKGKSSIFMTLDALERLAPNLKKTLKDKWRNNFGE